MMDDIHSSIAQDLNRAYLCWMLKCPMSEIREERNRDNELLQVAFPYFELRKQRELNKNG